ncbi:uncharacterized protein METZ01_LOCUS448195 [marine metagenome]|uniref:Uncharacterized protein n=1 Tax=marine metagenome TaxID=408172 RepID=A0A382ZIR1_9ZZZZ
MSIYKKKFTKKYGNGTLIDARREERSDARRASSIWIWVCPFFFRPISRYHFFPQYFDIIFFQPIFGHHQIIQGFLSYFFLKGIIL